MASFLDKFKMNTALTDNTKLDLSCQHITTADWMQYSPVYVKEMVPGEKISVQLQTFTRLQPLVVPTLGRMNVNNRAFFVPYRTIFRAWNDFITDTEHAFADGDTRLVDNVPFIDNEVFVECFTNSVFNMSLTTTSSADFAVANNQGTLTNYKLTRKGRNALKFLNSLGYEIMFIDGQDYRARYSALPILAAAKVWYDWYAPSQYLSNQQITNLLQLLSRDDVTSLGTSIDAQTLNTVFDVLLTVLYDSDPFVSAWDNPVAPSTGNYSTVSMSDVTLSGSSGTQPELTNRVAASGTINGTPVLISNSSTQQQIAYTAKLSQYMVDTLKALTDYMKRHQLVGARALDRYLARFGKQLTAEKLNRSNYIGTDKVPVQIGDVMNTADTSQGTLGDFAGKGVGFGVNKPFEFETDEYGLFMVISSVVPAVGYYQGKDKQLVGHLNRLDFYTPEFDSLGTQAITRSELYVPNFVTDYAGDMPESWVDSANFQYDNSIFGFTPRYSEYKYGRDKLTGDFRCASLNSGTNAAAGAGSWHLLRTLNYEEPTDVVHNYQFVKSSDSQAYDRIFANTTTAADHFTMIYNINVASWSPMKPLFENYEFEDKGKKVDVDANGVKMN